MPKKLLFIPLCLVILLSMSCASKFEKLLKSSDYALKYKEAHKHYQASKYERAAILFESAMPFYRNTPQDDSIQYYIAECFYAQKDYGTAEHYYSSFSKNFARSKFTEISDFRIGKCSYAMVPRSELDQSYAYKAIQAFELYLYKYPNSPNVAECKEALAYLNSHLAEKAHLSAKLYFKTSEYKAATITFKNCLKDFPDSKYREEQLYYTLLSADKLAQMSITSKQRERYQNTVDEYLNLISEFPQTKYQKESKRIFEKASRIIKTYEGVSSEELQVNPDQE